MNSDKAVSSLLNLYAPSNLQQTDHINRLNNLQPVPDVHGDRIFLLEIQCVRPDHDQFDVLSPLQYEVCDRQRSLKGYLRSKGKNPPWSTLVKQIPPMTVGEKIYRWAKRAGNWELSICLDREPGEKEKLAW